MSARATGADRRWWRDMRTQLRVIARWCLVVALGTGFVGCQSTGSPELIEFWAVSDLSESRAWLLPERSTTGGGADQLGIIAGNMGIVRYWVDVQRRPFLLDGDLESGIYSLFAVVHRDYLRLPRLHASNTTRSVFISEADAPKWTSFRVYDAGACSMLLPWEDVARLIVRRLDRAFEQASFADDPIYGAHRVPWDPEHYDFFSARVVPILRARSSRGAGALDVDEDRLQVWARYDAMQVGNNPLDCDDVRMWVKFEFGLERTDGLVRWDQDTTCPISPAISPYRVRDGSAHDFAGVLPERMTTGEENPDVFVSSDFCHITGSIASAVANTIADELPTAVEDGLRDALLLDPSRVGYTTSECSCDWDCPNPPGRLRESGYPPGWRHRCVVVAVDGAPPAGQCWVQLEPDRVNVRPDGLQIVLSDGPDDLQDAWMHADQRFVALCNFLDATQPSAPVSSWRGQMSAVELSD